MSRRAAYGVVLVGLAAGALAFRASGLGNRPMHCDEAVHAFKFRKLWETGQYRYDPNEFHGPTLYYATLPVVWARGVRSFAETTEADYRLVTVVFGAAMVLLLALFADGLGRRATVWAGLLTAVSPAFVFYSRYYIQETLLAFFTLGMLGAGWRYARSRGAGWAVLAGVFAGLMIATKETAVLAFAAAAIALLPAVVRVRRADPTGGGKLPWRARHAALAVVAAVLVAAVVVAGFFSNLAGPLDYLRSYLAWVPRGTGTDLHKQPWHYYLSLLTYTHRAQGPVWSEGLIVALAAVGLIAGLLGSRLRLPGMHAGLVRFLSLYTLTLTALYALIPYKTPWCLLSFLQGMILLAGVGAAALTGARCPTPSPASPRLRVSALRRVLCGAVCLALLAATAQLAWQSYGASYTYPTDGRNPYAYSTTVPDLLELSKRVNELGAVSPQRGAMVIKVFSVDPYYWPLPWYLRRFANVGYWTKVPADADAPVVICSPEFDEELIRRLDATHLMTGHFGLRPKVLLEVWVRMDLWEPYIMGRQKAKPPGPPAAR